MLALLLCAVCACLIAQPATAAASVSVNVVIIGGSTLSPDGGDWTAANVMGWTGGGFLPVTGPIGELGDMTFTAMMPADVSAASLTPFDTVVLNVASYEMFGDTNMLTAAQKLDLIAFVGSGKKLIIYDSECDSQDYSWLPYPFTTANPGAMGAQGMLTIVEENTLSSNDPLSPYFIDAPWLSSNTDAVGDMNVMTTFDSNWCLDMAGTNVLGISGPVHTYANYPAGTDKGLIIYNGLDQDCQYNPDPWLRKIWVLELQQPFNPGELPSSVKVIGITLSPASASNPTGTNHTVTATITDLLGVPQPGKHVTFSVVSGPNVGAGGTLLPADGNTDANGQVTFTYTSNGQAGIDRIEASFVDNAGTARSDFATKEWVSPVQPPLASFMIKALKIDWRHDNGKPKADKIKVDGELDLPAGYTPAQLDQEVFVLIEIGSRDGTDMVLTGLKKHGLRWDYKRPKDALPDGFNMDFRKLRIDWNKKGDKPDKFKFSGELDHDVFNDGSGIVTVTLLLPVLSGGDLAGSEIVTCDIHKHDWEYHRKK